ncbi:predicted protein [Thalassiosira pseudonana CCMP1335]|jgi:hypothetical protein|uniref:EF-hand domain-containing protein n=1 Tax=Thalassiosira pseudonana TaxID=35128 RepID=B8CF59_THAPS|nr:predicted protein [Thalassiosira pseudonana CCMP1335]EED88023.1 predicted protein [Thalassiosira pseudonana CCMP1335]|eukprot:g8013.t1 g8013   contig26:798695-800630(+)
MPSKHPSDDDTVETADSTQNSKSRFALPVKKRKAKKKAAASSRGSRYVTSEVSKMYDLDGDGKLDKIERAMRDYDVDNSGDLSNQEVYQIVKEQLQAQRKAKQFKTAVMALIAVTAILAVSNLGTSFAAMFLAKEMSADTDTGAMRVASTGEIAAVQTSGETYELTDLTAEQYQERRALVLSEMEEDPHSHSHRRHLAKNNKGNKKCNSKNPDPLCNGDILFDNGVIPEAEFRIIEQKCTQQKNVNIRRRRDADTKSDCICSRGTSVVVKEKKKTKAVVDYKKGPRKNKNTDREVIIVSEDKRKLNVDCVNGNCYVSGDILLGQYGDTCDINLDECEADLVCDSSASSTKIRRSIQYGICTYPRFVVRSGGVCDTSYGLDACGNGYYCLSEDYVNGNGNLRSGGSSSSLNIVGSSGSISVGNVASSNARTRSTVSSVGYCTKRVGNGGDCFSGDACIDGYSCIGNGGAVVGASAGSAGRIVGPSGVVEWGNVASYGWCTKNTRASSGSSVAGGLSYGDDCTNSRKCGGLAVCRKSNVNGSDRWFCE